MITKRTKANKRSKIAINVKKYRHIKFKFKTFLRNIDTQFFPNSPDKFKKKRMLKQTFIQSIYSFHIFSPSLTSKKSNEILQGGLSSIKHAATSVAKKLDEIKEAISATSTPVKSSGSLSERGEHGSEDDLLNEHPTQRARAVSADLDLWGRLSESRKSSYNNLVPLGENTTANSAQYSAYPVLPDNVYTQPPEVKACFATFPFYFR